MTHIDLNCDMGESYGVWRMGDDAGVMPWVSSINVACGFHAGDPVTMHRTLKAAAAAGVAVGAHVSLPDLAGFGRRAMAVSADELYAMTVVQLGALAAMARCRDLVPGHVKPHGALYHMVESDAALAGALVQAVHDVDASLRVVGFAGGQLCRVADEAGLPIAHEAFTDRRYGTDGKLLPRGTAGAVIEDMEAAVAQAVALARDGCVTDTDDNVIRIPANTLCIHGDRPNAATFAEALHTGLQEAGIEIQPLPRA
jgi:UPF0271 protein